MASRYFAGVSRDSFKQSSIRFVFFSRHCLSHCHTGKNAGDCQGEKKDIFFHNFIIIILIHSLFFYKLKNRQIFAGFKLLVFWFSVFYKFSVFKNDIATIFLRTSFTFFMNLADNIVGTISIFNFHYFLLFKSSDFRNISIFEMIVNRFIMSPRQALLRPLGSEYTRRF